MPDPLPIILVVDDEQGVRQLCKIVLEMNGFRPILAANGRQGLNIFKEMHPEIALVLADVTMPVMRGVEMVDQIFQIQAHANVILMTGYASEEFVLEYLKKVYAVLAKPFKPSEILEVIRKCLKYEEEHAFK
jgi:DNA-binding NtrC family response regulator